MGDMPILPFAGKPQTEMGRLQLADKVTLQPGQQTKALVQSNMTGTLIVEPAQELMTKYGVSASNGVHKVNRFSSSSSSLPILAIERSSCHVTRW